jgi:Escherichia/Staphylococcus phage prohead protease
MTRVLIAKANQMLQRFGENLPMREVKFAACDLKAVEADGTFHGYASLFGEVDLGQDLVMPGAFRDSLRLRGARGVKLLFQHDPNEPIGVWLELAEDSRGLFARGRLMPEVTRAREVLSLMRAGALDGLSIGFRTVKGRTDAKTGVRRLDQIDLWEISIVTFPMLPEARVSAVKRGPGRTAWRTRHVSGLGSDRLRLLRSLRRATRLLRA